MNEQYIINRLLQLINETRTAQRTYFASKTPVNDRLRKIAEDKLDTYARELTRRGYGGVVGDGMQGKLM